MLMIIGIYILCVTLIVCMFILFVMLDRIKDIQDDMQLIRMRAFRSKDDNAVETYDVSSLHPTSIASSDIQFGYKYSHGFANALDKMQKENFDEFKNAIITTLDNQKKELEELENKLSYLEQTVNDHENKLNELYIEE